MGRLTRIVAVLLPLGLLQPVLGQLPGAALLRETGTDPLSATVSTPTYPQWNTISTNIESDQSAPDWQLDKAKWQDCFDEARTWRPKVKFTLDATVQQRAGAGGSDPLILDAPFPLGAPLLTADELDIDGLWGGRLELVVFDPTPNPTDLRFSYMWTERGETRESRSSNPADVLFFNIVDASPSNTYTARLQSRFAMGDIGIRKEKRPGVGVFAGLAIGELSESLDLLTAPTTGFFSQGTNSLFGANFGVDAQLWSNGYTRVEGGAGYGLYYNDIEINAQSQNWQRTWSESSLAYMGQFHFAWVIPAYPLNFRLGYQFTYVGGLGLLADQSDGLQLFDGGGSVDTDGTIWHGFLFGVEYLR